MTVLGTRPEIIRLSRVIPRLDESFDHTLVHTGQNYDVELSQEIFDDLGLRSPDRYLGVGPGSLGQILGRTLIGVEEAILESRPNALLVLGDTNSCIAAVIAKRLRVPVYHMEAGNRCFDDNVPEETNRRLVDHVSDFNLVYTEHARRNLLAEGLPARRISLTGSPMAEVLTYYAGRIGDADVLDKLGLEAGGYILLSAHREETVDERSRLTDLTTTMSDVRHEFGRPVLVSTHPRTRSRLEQLGITDLEGVVFHAPFGFCDYVHLQRHAFFVLSDSGTISEESAILDFPAVTLRDAIERPEALEAGAMITTGVESSIVRASMRQVLAQRAAGDFPSVPVDYQVENCSQRVANFIRATSHVHHAWAGVRRSTPD
jgi:UDP-N-acetylglucosamine 2-epimerase (non-hydrolysing)